MSLMGTLAKVAIGVALAKGASTLAKNAKAQTGAQNPGTGSVFGDSQSSESDTASNGGGLEGILGGLLGGQGQSGGGLGGLLESMQGSAQTSDGSGKIDDFLHDTSGQSGSQGPLGGLLESLTKGQGNSASGGLSDLLGGLMGGAAQTGKPNGNFGDLLNQSFQRGGEPEVQPTREQDAAAGLMLRAMIQAAKADGKIDDAEREKLLSNLGDVSQQERDFVRAEMQAPVDVQSLARQVPRGLENQIYIMSLSAIDLDHQGRSQIFA